MNDAVTRWEHSALNPLIDHLLAHHHAYTRSACDALAPQCNEVCAAHAARHPELMELQRLFLRLRDDLQLHLSKEENILFPYLRTLEQPGPLVRPPFGAVVNPVRMMTMEHHTDGLILQRMTELTANFRPPADADAALEALYRDLLALVEDLHLHMYLENNILFSRAIGIERERLNHT